jgi:hypothetical protein
MNNEKQTPKQWAFFYWFLGISFVPAMILVSAFNGPWNKAYLLASVLVGVVSGVALLMFSGLHLLYCRFYRLPSFFYDPPDPVPTWYIFSLGPFVLTGWVVLYAAGFMAADLPFRVGQLWGAAEEIIEQSREQFEQGRRDPLRP